MNDGVREQYRVVVDAIGTDLRTLGFDVAPGRDEMLRSVGAVTRRLAVSLRVPTGGGVGFVEVFPGFNIPQLETLAADLQGKKPRPGFLTCSLNVGLLMPNGGNVEWRLGGGDDPAAVARLATGALREFAVPFWGEFTSVGQLLAHYDAGDRRVCRGAEWPWRRVASCVLLGDTARAVSLLDAMRATAAPAVQPTIERALGRLPSPAAG